MTALPPLDIQEFGPVTSHNQRCGVCLERHAVHLASRGLMAPCWKCQQAGWRTVQVPLWLVWVARKLMEALP